VNNATNGVSGTMCLECVFPFEREDVYAAWTSPELLKQWWWGAGNTAPSTAEVDLRVGGRLCLELQLSDGRTRRASGRYLEISRPERLAYTWSWDIESGDPEVKVVRVELSEHPRGTRVVVEESGYLGTPERITRALRARKADGDRVA